MKTVLERLEEQSGRGYQHSTHDLARVREKAATAPGDLTEIDFAVLAYFNGPRAEAQARAAYDKARNPPAAPAAPVAADDVGERTILRVEHLGPILGVIKDAITQHVTPLQEKIVALEATLAAVEKQLTESKAIGALYDGGDWTHGVLYEKGAAVRAQGSIWICKDTHFSVGTSLDHSKFKLWLKRPSQR